MKPENTPEGLVVAKTKMRAEIKDIHARTHVIQDFQEFAKRARLELQQACDRLQRAHRGFVFKVGDVKPMVDPENKKEFLHGTIYVGPKRKADSTMFVALNFTLANAPEISS